MNLPSNNHYSDNNNINNFNNLNDFNNTKRSGHRDLPDSPIDDKIDIKGLPGYYRSGFDENYRPFTIYGMGECTQN
jgi:hypothetical protein